MLPADMTFPDSMWYLMFAGDWKGHWVPKQLLRDLIQDGIDRYHEFHSAEPSTGGIIDLPGMMMVDRKYRTFKIDTFELRIPSQDFKHFYEKVQQNPKRTFTSGQEYYKIHGWMHCLVLTPEQRDLLLQVMTETMDEALREAKEQEDEFQRRTAQINKDQPRIIQAKEEMLIPRALVLPPNRENN